MARESKNGGNVKSNAAAIQSSGRRGILVSVLIGLLVLLVLIPGWSEQTQSAQAVVKMHLPKGWGNFNDREGEGHKAVAHVQPRSPTG